MKVHDSEQFRRQFPLFEKLPQLIYLDNAATTQKPRSVVDRLSEFYFAQNANVDRGVYPLSECSTMVYARARRSVADYIGAASPEEIIFVRGATEAINLVADSWSRAFLKPGDEILITAMEHHSNILPWQEVANRNGAKLLIVDILPNGELDLDDFWRKLSDRTKMLAITQASNVLGTIPPLNQLIPLAKARGAAVLVDGSQWMAHGPVKVRELGCDFYVFSGHKMFAPMGIGVVYGRRSLLEAMPPYQIGGGMVERVTPGDAKFRPVPAKFEAGTPNVACAVALGSAIDFLKSVDWQAYGVHQQQIRDYLESEFAGIPEIQYLGSAPQKVSVYAIHSKKVHGHDLATFLGEKQIALRAGHHCAQLLMPYFEINHSLRASFSLYNSLQEAKIFIQTLREALQRLS